MQFLRDESSISCHRHPSQIGAILLANFIVACKNNLPFENRKYTSSRVINFQFPNLR